MYVLHPSIDTSVAYRFCPVCLSTKNFNIGHYFSSDRAFIFHHWFPWGETFSMVIRSRSSVTVTISEKLWFRRHSFTHRLVYTVSQLAMGQFLWNSIEMFISNQRSAYCVLVMGEDFFKSYGTFMVTPGRYSVTRSNSRQGAVGGIQ